MSTTLAAASRPGSSSSAIKTILLAGFVAGSLDMLAAIIVTSVRLHHVLFYQPTATLILQSIAAGVFGQEAFDGSNKMLWFGLGFHFIIAFSFAIFYFIVFPYLAFLRKQKILSGLLYGIFAWMVMNLAVLPLLRIANIPHKWDAIARGAGILMFCIGLPVSLIVHRHYMSRDR